MTYEELVKANELIKTTDIKGKDYAEVPQRIKAFRSVFPEGSIVTELLKDENGVCTFRAVVMNGSQILGTGTAQEKESSSFINKTSYIENCETSAVGRALGMCGFGIDTSVASAEEVQNAINNQGEQKKSKAEKQSQKEETKEEKTALAFITKVMVTALQERCASDGVDSQELCKLYRVEALNKLTNAQYQNMNQYWEQVKEKLGGKK